ncbi:xanthine dehydrogenase family protein molybdopterin-binding subunit [Sporohalobacter salinus]|uniref:xanthine dehydrogenase family protein molybdopterin-binding subunit n=1 Tax=Sporohalobacter salinus TaxID=1494606 RepID=UPI00196180A8|nr:molybdopterin cofactor-binding domain-containing protein [Sporohalobacter salinus]MBM7622499.1 CO/xanthine dehydrogenase Mo-binding subunit [Sporohalobacter salinus]
MKKYGTGISTIMFGFGYGEGFPDHSVATVEITEDEIIRVKTAAADVGQGVDTVVAQIVSEVLNIDPAYIKLQQADTHSTKNAGSTSATRQTFFTGNAVKNAAEELLSKIYHYASLEFTSNHPEMEVDSGEIFLHEAPEEERFSYWELAEKVKERDDNLQAEGSFFPKTYEPDLRTGQAEKVYVAYTFMTQEVEVEVNINTGQVEILNINSAIDLGKAINPKGAEGQIEGGTAQGIGMALMEDQIIEDGITINPNLSGYIIPTAMDIPPMQSRLVEDEASDGPFGAKGIGEPCTIGAAPAIANAVYDAIGVRFYELPITPEKILKALKEKEK